MNARSGPARAGQTLVEAPFMPRAETPDRGLEPSDFSLQRSADHARTTHPSPGRATRVAVNGTGVASVSVSRGAVGTRRAEGSADQRDQVVPGLKPNDPQSGAEGLLPAAIGGAAWRSCGPMLLESVLSTRWVPDAVQLGDCWRLTTHFRLPSTSSHSEV